MNRLYNSGRLTFKMPALNEFHENEQFYWENSMK